MPYSMITPNYNHNQLSSYSQEGFLFLFFSSLFFLQLGTKQTKMTAPTTCTTSQTAPIAAAAAAVALPIRPREPAAVITSVTTAAPVQMPVPAPTAVPTQSLYITVLKAMNALTRNAASPPRILAKRLGGPAYIQFPNCAGSIGVNAVLDASYPECWRICASEVFPTLRSIPMPFSNDTDVPVSVLAFEERLRTMKLMIRQSSKPDYDGEPHSVLMYGAKMLVGLPLSIVAEEVPVGKFPCTFKTGGGPFAVESRPVVGVIDLILWDHEHNYFVIADAKCSTLGTLRTQVLSGETVDVTQVTAKYMRQLHIYAAMFEADLALAVPGNRLRVGALLLIDYRTIPRHFNRFWMPYDSNTYGDFEKLTH